MFNFGECSHESYKWQERKKYHVLRTYCIPGTELSA